MWHRVDSRRRGWSRLFSIMVAGGLAVATASSAVRAQATPPAQVEFAGGANSPISSMVALPANTALIWTSGTVPGAADRNAPAGSRARFGDTKTQAISILQRIDALLKEKGLGLKDVVYLRAYLVPDKEKGGAIDTQGWNEAYGQFFNTASNPTKPARSTVGVSALVNADWLIEIEAFAAYPAASR
jgi:enamine deaminase RidA (YjgF/YER057c/UK114 family)